MNLDGRDDVVLSVSNLSGPPLRIEVRYATGTGTFTAPVVAYSGQNAFTNSAALAAARVNGDAWPDIVFAAFPAPSGDGDIRVLLANGLGGYDVAQTIPADGGTVRLADLDQDGQLDLVYADETDDPALTGRGVAVRGGREPGGFDRSRSNPDRGRTLAPRPPLRGERGPSGAAGGSALGLSRRPHGEGWGV
ncbi:MAG: VCBS repeat-containing protein [Deltaproteobacteria bacterium]|nr:VCBS repeat-containing protein [Deltaproteobacteria bacterium]